MLPKNVSSFLGNFLKILVFSKKLRKFLDIFKDINLTNILEFHCPLNKSARKILVNSIVKNWQKEYFFRFRHTVVTI